MDRSVFVAPPATGGIGSAGQRQRVVLSGLVVRVVSAQWVGGPVLEVRLRDLSGEISLAFLGRKVVGGVEPGALVTVAGTVGRRQGRATILNPQIWLEGARPGRSGSVDIAAMAQGRGTARSARA
jgi:hypothetical protein